MGGEREGAGRTPYELASIFVEREVEKHQWRDRVLALKSPAPCAVCWPGPLESSLLPWEGAGVITRPTDSQR